MQRALSTGEFKDHRVEADQRLAAVVESSQDAILSADREGVITAWSRGAERLFGYTQREAIGQPVGLMYPPGYAGEDKELVRRVMAGERIESHVTERMHKDGSVLNVSLSISPIYARSGRRARPVLRAATEALSRFPGPALIVWASEDRVMPPAHANRMAALLPDSHLVEIPDAYTLLTIDQPGAVAAALRSFLAREPDLASPAR